MELRFNTSRLQKADITEEEAEHLVSRGLAKRIYVTDHTWAECLRATNDLADSQAEDHVQKQEDN